MRAHCGQFRLFLIAGTMLALLTGQSEAHWAHYTKPGTPGIVAGLRAPISLAEAAV